MSGPRSWAPAFASIVCGVFCGALLGQPAWAQDADSDGMAHATVHLDIPAQPLASALQAFGRIAHMMVMGETAQLGARTSAPLSGDYTRQDALRRLLAGTGLDARFVDAQSVAIVPLSPDPRGGPPSSSVRVPLADIDGFEDGDAGYLALVQARLTEALCRSPQTRPGGYRLVVQLRIDVSGAVSASRLIGSTGDPLRDASIASTVGNLRFDDGPPASFRQPVTILLRPEDGMVTNGCALAGADG